MAEQNILRVYLSPTSGLLVRYLDMVVKDCCSLTSLLKLSQASGPYGSQSRYLQMYGIF